jgi:Raf kinase inhibitor-like YbhB/YbcL family protein
MWLFDDGRSFPFAEKVATRNFGAVTNSYDCKKMFGIVCSQTAVKFGRIRQMEFRRLVSVFTMGLGLAVAVAGQTPGAQGGGQAAPAPPAMTMSTTAFADGTEIPAKYTQAGNQTSPALTWTNVPPGTVTLLLHMHDLEFSRNHTLDDQLHWLVWNIPATATGLPEGVPAGAQLQNGAYQLSASGAVYRGPGAAANGPRHHYTFELIALDTKLDIQPGTDAFETRAAIMKAIQGHILGKAVYMGLFHRPQ